VDEIGEGFEGHGLQPQMNAATADERCNRR